MTAKKTLKKTATESRMIDSIEVINDSFEQMGAEERIRWSLDNLPVNPVLSSSFGIQSAVMLHMLVSQKPDIPVILTDTGHLFPETYRFIDELTERLNLNLKVYRSHLSPSWQEARFGRLWEKGVDGIKEYNRINKVEPMARAFNELDTGTWFSGLRRTQAESRSKKPFVEHYLIDGLNKPAIKVYPILDWSNRDVHQYLEAHDLPYHPLWEEGYTSVGDTHTTRKWEPGMTEEETRFFGLTRECGLHDISEAS